MTKQKKTAMTSYKMMDMAMIVAKQSSTSDIVKCWIKEAFEMLSTRDFDGFIGYAQQIINRCEDDQITFLIEGALRAFTSKNDKVVLA